MADDIVDLTPNQGQNKREVFLTPEDRKIIKDNPRGLTKEGCMVRVWQWSLSDNFPQLVRYLAMYKLCKTFKESGKTTDGKTILSRTIHTKNGMSKEYIWSEAIGDKDELGEVIIAKSIEDLEKYVKSRLDDLRFVTTKGVV